MGRSFAENGRAAARVRAEAPEPLAALAAAAGAGVGTLTRWVVAGKCGVHLDAYRDRKTGDWYSSVAAVARFVAEVVREEEHRAEVTADRLADLERRGTAPADCSVMVPTAPRPEVVAVGGWGDSTRPRCTG